MEELPRKVQNLTFSSNDQTARNVQPLEWRINHIVVGLSIATVFSCGLLFFRGFGTPATSILIAYNFLFASLAFPLAGSLVAKTSLLLLGNSIGLLWNYGLFLLINVLEYLFGESYQVSYVIVSSFSNMMWIVAFYSTSLTFLASLNVEKAGSAI